jgi:hypothetical protein
MDAVVPSSEPPAETPRAGHAYYPAPPRGQGQRDLHWIVQQPRQPPAPLPDAGPATTPGLPTFQGQAARCPSVRVCTFTQVEWKGRGPVTVTPSSFELSLELSDLPGGTDPGNSSVASQAQPSEGRSSRTFSRLSMISRAPPPPRTSLRSSTQRGQDAFWLGGRRSLGRWSSLVWADGGEDAVQPQNRERRRRHGRLRSDH